MPLLSLALSAAWWSIFQLLRVLWRWMVTLLSCVTLGSGFVIQGLPRFSICYITHSGCFYPWGILPFPCFPVRETSVSVTVLLLVTHCLFLSGDFRWTSRKKCICSPFLCSQKANDPQFGFVVVCLFVVSFVRFLLSSQWLTVLHISGNWEAELFPFSRANAH